MVRPSAACVGAVVLAGLLAACGTRAGRDDGARPGEADLVVAGGHVLTMDDAGSVVEAFVVRDGRILATGTSEAMRRLGGPGTPVSDLHGRTVLPGFIDGHAHPQLAIRMRSYLDAHYSVTPSLAAMFEKLRARAAATPRGEWLIVAGAAANTAVFPEQRLPTRLELDAVAPAHPVLYLNGPHTWVANTAALARLGAKRGERVLRGAFIELDAAGEPTGVIHEGAPIFPELVLPPDVLRRYAMEEIPGFFLPLGYTTVVDIMPLANYGPIRELAASGARAPIRYAIAVFADSGGKHLPADLVALRMPSGVDPEWFRLAGIKIWQDGDIPVRTGLLFGHYAGEPDNHGIATNTQQELNNLALRVHGAGLGFFVHSTGDRSNVMVLDAFENVREQGGPKTLLRIEHFGVFMLGPGVLARAKALDVEVNVQPAWLYTLAKVTARNLGAEVAEAQSFQFRRMLEAGLEPGFGSDLTGFQRDTENPFLHVEALLTRKTLDGSSFVPEQATSLDAALRMLTIWSARSLGEDERKGSLEAGKLADWIVLSEDVTRTAPERIDEIRVLETWVGGRRVHPRTD